MSALGHDWPRPDTDDWRNEADCADRPDLNWFPTQGERFAEQLAVCASCPVRQRCLDDALAKPANHDFGIWGGTSEAERVQIRRGHTRAEVRRMKAECGTRSGYTRHVKLHEKTCDACKAANAAYQRLLKERAG